MKKWKKDSKNAGKYIEFLEEKIGVQIKYIATCHDREDTIVL